MKWRVLCRRYSALVLFLISFSAQAESVAKPITLPDGTEGFFLNREAMEEAVMNKEEAFLLEQKNAALQLRLSEAYTENAKWEQIAKDNGKTARFLGWTAIIGTVVSLGVGIALGISLAR